MMSLCSVDAVFSGRCGSLPVSIAASGLGGRGLFTNRDVKGGEILVAEPPLVSVVMERSKRNTCASCLRTTVRRHTEANTLLTEMLFKCENCLECYYCSQQCKNIHEASGAHSPRVCSRLRNVAGVAQNQGLDLDQKTLLKWLSIVLSFRDDSLTDEFSKANWATICNLDPCNTEANFDGSHAFLNKDSAKMVSCLEELSIFTDYNQVNRLMVVDSRNTFALANVSKYGERLPRAHATYTLASLVNHECLPSSCRFDSADLDPQSQEGSRGEIFLRALHDLPKGTEITLSYNPLGWDVSSRQERFINDYGFTCQCERCNFEMGQHIQEDNEEMAAYCGIFLFKHICPVEYCGGTMCPKNARDNDQENVYECNVCQRERTEAEFMTELEDMHSDEYDKDSDDIENDDSLCDDINDMSMDTD